MQVDIFYVTYGEYLRVEMYGIAVDTVAHAECLKDNIVVADGFFYVIVRDAEPADALVGSNHNLRPHYSAVIDHCHFGQLLDTLADDIPYESGGLFRLSASDIHIESGNVQCSRLHHFRTFHILGHDAHGTVNLLIDLYEQKTHVTARTERQAYHSRISPGCGFYLFQSGHL